MSTATTSVRTPVVPCAIYTRKSSEEGLEQDFNSLDAQREACGAYILSQKALGWTPVKDIYDDGGYSGGNTERPGLKQLMADIAAGKVKVVVVYKVDRLTRSLADFAKIVEHFDSHGVSFVSVTQQFNTTTSMGRLTLNVLLSFAQFEREVTGERIRDKIAASKRKGIWMGGLPPMGYKPVDRQLVIVEDQAERVREIFRLYLALGNVRLLQAEMERRGWRTPFRKTKRNDAAGNRPFSEGHLYKILHNPIYVGRIAHFGEVFPGNHPPIVDEELWQKVQTLLESNRQGHHKRERAVNRSLLVGLVFDPQGNRFTPGGNTIEKNGVTRRYHVYVQQLPVEGRTENPLRIPGRQLESAVAKCLEDFLQDEAQLLLAGPQDEVPQAHAIRKAHELRLLLAADPMEAFRTVLEKVVIDETCIELHIKSAVIWGESPEGSPVLVHRVPAAFKRRAWSLRLIVKPDEQQEPEADQRLIRLVARGFEWAMALTSGRAKRIADIAAQEGVTGSYVTRLIQIGFMAPDLIELIAQGKQPVEFTSIKLMSVGALPLNWDEQRLVVGLER